MLEKKHSLLISVHKICFLWLPNSCIIQKTHGMMALLVLHLNLFMAPWSQAEQPMMVAWLELHERQRPKIEGFTQTCDTVMAKSEMHREDTFLLLKSSSFRINLRNLGIHKTTAMVVEIATEFSENSYWHLENKFRSLGRAVRKEVSYSSFPGQLLGNKGSRAPKNHLCCISTVLPCHPMCIMCKGGGCWGRRGVEVGDVRRAALWMFVSSKLKIIPAHG